MRTGPLLTLLERGWCRHHAIESKVAESLCLLRGAAGENVCPPSDER